MLQFRINCNLQIRITNEYEKAVIRLSRLACDKKEREN
jgi:hypothetical protein